MKDPRGLEPPGSFMITGDGGPVAGLAAVVATIHGFLDGVARLGSLSVMTVLPRFADHVAGQRQCPAAGSRPSVGPAAAAKYEVVPHAVDGTPRDCAVPPVGAGVSRSERPGRMTVRSGR